MVAPTKASVVVVVSRTTVVNEPESSMLVTGMTIAAVVFKGIDDARLLEDGVID